MAQMNLNAVIEFSKEELQRKYNEFAPNYNRAEWINILHSWLAAGTKSR